MVVIYKTASEGSWASFFVVNPQILCHWEGSIIPKVLPQVLLAIGLGAIARWWNPLEGQHEDVQAGISILGVLLSFLMVFKTQSAYGQFWEACTEVQRMLQLSRNISMTACTFFPFDNSRLLHGTQMVDGVPIDVWFGGALKVRVIAAYDLLDQDRDSGYLDTIIRVGSQSFKTKAVIKQLNPVWDSEVFEFTLSQEDSAITFVLREAHIGAQDNLGWLHLRSSDLLRLTESKWQKLRLPLQDGSCGELELELCFTRSSSPSSGAPASKTLLAVPREIGAPAAPSPKQAGRDSSSQKLLDAGFNCAPPPDTEEFLKPFAVSVQSGGMEQEQLKRKIQDLDLPVEAFLRRIVRLQALYFFVVVEYFRRTGQNAVHSKEDQDAMREQIKQLTGEREYAMLYPGERRETPGSGAKVMCANPTVVLYWLQLTIGRCGAVHRIPAPVLASFVPLISQLADNFFLMDRIDKCHFPLPYAQVVKILCIVFVFILLPWVLQPRCQDLTELVIGLVALGFFGLDEVAEILESPFGNDPNHIDLWSYGEVLIDDLELMYYGRQKQLDMVFTEGSHGLFDNVTRKRSELYRMAKEAFTVTGKTRQL